MSKEFNPKPKKSKKHLFDSLTTFLKTIFSKKKSFRYLQTMIDEAGGEIVLDFDVEFSGYDSKIRIDIDNLVIDGKGHTIDAINESAIMVVCSKGVTIKNIDFTNSKGSCLEITEDASLNLINCNFDGNVAEKGSCILNSGGHLNLLDCSFTNNSALKIEGQIGQRVLSIEGESDGKDSSICNGGAIYNSGEMTLKRCDFSNNSSCENGGCIVNSNGVLNLEKCGFSDNSASNRAGAIDNVSNSKAELNACKFENNTAEDGGAVSNMRKCRLSVKYCNFENNQSGAILNHLGLADISNCLFSNNQSHEGGGAIDNYLGFMKVFNTHFKGNLAKDDGGAIFNGGKIETIEKCLFEANDVLSKGGAIYMTRSSHAKILKSGFSSNSSKGIGGAIFNNASAGRNSEYRLDLIDCDFSGNGADDGGAIYNSGEISLDGCSFTDNVPNDRNDLN